MLHTYLGFRRKTSKSPIEFSNRWFRFDSSLSSIEISPFRLQLTQIFRENPISSSGNEKPWLIRERNHSDRLFSIWLTFYMLVIGGNKMGKLAVAAITSLWVIPMSIIVNNIVPEPYMVKILIWEVRFSIEIFETFFISPNYLITASVILQDEIFHVPQAQQYCYGNLRSWNPMITTPPGL